MDVGHDVEKEFSFEQHINDDLVGSNCEVHLILSTFQTGQMFSL